jgi:hypothetical protein
VSGATVFESNLVISNTTSSISNVTGALVVAGGAGIAGNVYANALRTTTGIYWAGNGNPIAGITYTASASSPAGPSNGDQWYNTATDKLYGYLFDGVSSYWVDIQTSIIAANVSSSGSTGSESTVFTLSGTTTGNTETEIFVGGISNTRIDISANTTVAYDIVVVARRTDTTGFSAAFNLKGVIDNFSGTVADVGSLYENILARDDSNYLVDARADDANNSLNIYVTGVAGHTINWTAKTTLVGVQ